MMIGLVFEMELGKAGQRTPPLSAVGNPGLQQASLTNIPLPAGKGCQFELY